MKHILLIFFISLTIVSCKEEPKKVPPIEVKLVPEYNIGDVVYLKPDSLPGIVTDSYQWDSIMEYRIGYRLRSGEMYYRDFKSFQIYGKK